MSVSKKIGNLALALSLTGLAATAGCSKNKSDTHTPASSEMAPAGDGMEHHDDSMMEGEEHEEMGEQASCGEGSCGEKSCGEGSCG